MQTQKLVSIKTQIIKTKSSAFIVLLLHKTIFQGNQITDDGKLCVRFLADKYRKNEDLKERRDWDNEPQ